MISYQPLSEAEQKRIAAIIEKVGGKSQAARFLGCSRLTVKAAAGGLAVHPWMAEKLAKAIAARDAEGKNP